MNVKKTLLIVEGPDGAGKTTLIKSITAKTKATVIHFDKPKPDEDSFLMYLRVMVDALRDENEVLIMDRAWYSEIVYHAIMRPDTAELLDKEQIITLELAALQLYQPLVIRCTAAFEVLRKRCDTRGEDYVAQATALKAISDMYDTLTIRLPCITIRTDMNACS